MQIEIKFNSGHTFNIDIDDYIAHFIIDDILRSIDSKFVVFPPTYFVDGKKISHIIKNRVIFDDNSEEIIYPREIIPPKDERYEEKTTRQAAIDKYFYL